jgi:hypothetical protein
VVLHVVRGEHLVVDPAVRAGDREPDGAGLIVTSGCSISTSVGSLRSAP